MAIESFNAESMVNFHEISQLRIEADCCDSSLSRSLNRRIGSSSNIQPVMPRGFFCEWGNPWTKSRGNPSLHWPNGWGCRPPRRFVFGSQGQFLKRLFLDRSLFRQPIYSILD